MVENSNTVQLNFSESFENDQDHILRINNIKDSSDNALDTVVNFYFFEKEVVEYNDVVINELLFDPLGEGSDFVELVNRSTKLIDLKNWSLANYEDGIANKKKLSLDSYIVYPGEYTVITSAADLLSDTYPNSCSENVLEISRLPTYRNDSGTVYLLDDIGQLVDQFSYTKDMHFQLFKDTEGISLERLSIDEPTDKKSNWHSAAKAANYGTPGCVNSQVTEASTKEAIINLSSAIFSPDNDGFEDYLLIHHSLGSSGFVGTITIYDSNGRQVKQLVENELLAANGSTKWDGLNDQSQKAPIGVYLLHFIAFNVEGEVLEEKIPVVLATQLD